MSKDRVFSSESSSDSEDERPSRPKKTFTTVKLLGRKGYGTFSSTTSSSSSSRSPSPTLKTANDKPSSSASSKKKIGITIKKSPNSESRFETKPFSGYKRDSSDSDSSDRYVYCLILNFKFTKTR